MRRGVESTDNPCFPNYLFLRCDLGQEIQSALRSVRNCIGFVTFDGEVAAVPDEVMIEMEERIEQINRKCGIRRRFHPGEIVKVNSHNLNSLAEVIADSKGRVEVLLDLFGGSIPAKVEPEYLQRVDEIVNVGTRPIRRTRGNGRWIREINQASAAF